MDLFLAKIPAPPPRPSSRVRRIALATLPAKGLVAVGKSVHVADQVTHYTKKGIVSGSEKFMMC